MNKIQYTELLNLRGITELKNESIKSAVKKSGGDPTDKEMVKVNHKSMLYYIDKYKDEKTKKEKLKKQLIKAKLLINNLEAIIYNTNIEESNSLDPWDSLEDWDD